MRLWLLVGIVIIGISGVLHAQPATQPSDQIKQVEPDDPDVTFQLADGVIRLPDGRELNLNDLQAMGGSAVAMVTSSGDGGSSVHVIDDGRRISIQENENGEIVVKIREEGADPVEYRASSADELKANHPEAFELYEKYGHPEVSVMAPGAAAGGPGAGVFERRIQIGGPGPMGMGMGTNVESLGTTCAPIMDPFIKAQLGEGVRVMKVAKDSLGEKLGLQKHDLIKLVNGKAVEDPHQIEDTLDAADKVSLEIIRAGKPMTLQEN